MNKATRLKIKIAVLRALNNVDHLDMPVNIKAIVKSFSNCRLIPYSQHMSRHHLTYDEMLDFAGSEDAFTDYNRTYDKYIIYYNDVSMSIVWSYRYRWNIAHELGHVLLNHHTTNSRSRLFRNTLSQSEYRALEAEADYFASYILVPYAAFEEVKFQNSFEIASMCKISGAAAQYRYNDYLIWSKDGKFQDDFDYKIKRLFSEVVHIRYVNKYFSCSACFSHWSLKDSKYCPICGSHVIHNASIGEMGMEYSFVALDESGRAKICPRCGNPHMVPEGNYCIICGAHLVNECSDMQVQIGPNYDDVRLSPACSKGKKLPGNARYCPFCGNETTFLQQKLLSPWDDDTDVFTKPGNADPNELPF